MVEALELKDTGTCFLVVGFDLKGTLVEDLDKDLELEGLADDNSRPPVLLLEGVFLLDGGIWSISSMVCEVGVILKKVR